MRRYRDFDGPKSEGSQQKSFSQRLRDSHKLLKRKSQLFRRPQIDDIIEQQGEAVTPASLDRRHFAAKDASPLNTAGSNGPAARINKESIVTGVDRKDVIALQAAINRENQMVHRSKTPINLIKEKYRNDKAGDVQADHSDEFQCSSIPRIPIDFDSDEMRFSDAEEGSDEENSLSHGIHGSLVLGVATPRTLRSMKFKISLPTVVEDEEDGVSRDTGGMDLASSDE